MNDEIKGAAAGFWDWLDGWWNLPLVPRLTAGEVIVMAAGILALSLATILLNRLLRRLAPPSEGQDPHDSWLSLAVWVIRKPVLFLFWTAGIGALIISQLGPWLRVWQDKPLFTHPLFSLLMIVTLGGVLARALRAATRKLRAASLAAPTHWRAALALLARAVGALEVVARPLAVAVRTALEWLARRTWSAALAKAKLAAPLWAVAVLAR